MTLKPPFLNPSWPRGCRHWQSHWWTTLVMLLPNSFNNGRINNVTQIMKSSKNPFIDAISRETQANVSNILKTRTHTFWQSKDIRKILKHCMLILSYQSPDRDLVKKHKPSIAWVLSYCPVGKMLFMYSLNKNAFVKSRVFNFSCSIFIDEYRWISLYNTICHNDEIT